MLLNAQQILAINDRKTKTIPVPEWGEGAEVLIGSMGALEGAELHDWVETLGRPKAEPEAEPPEDGSLSCDSLQPEETSEEPAKPESREYSMAENVHVMIRWCSLSIIDPQSKERVFTNGQVETLAKRSLPALRRIYEAALELNHETQETHEAAEKNSGGIIADGSGSG